MAGSMNNTTRRFWPEDSKWSGAAVVGDYVCYDGHIYEIIMMPDAISLRATDPTRLRPDGGQLTVGAATNG